MNQANSMKSLKITFEQLGSGDSKKDKITELQRFNSEMVRQFEKASRQAADLTYKLYLSKDKVEFL